MTKVNNEINPCHKPIQKPATSVVNFSFPGAHEANIKNKDAIRVRLK